MASLDRSKEELFIEENAKKLAHNLAYHCAAGAKEIEKVICSNKLKVFNTDVIFLFLFCVRGTIEAKGVLHKFGERAYRQILAALDALYEATFSESAVVTGPFSASLMLDVETSLSQSPDPREWIRIHAIRTLETRDPDDELFHLFLAKVVSTKEPIVQLVQRSV